MDVLLGRTSYELVATVANYLCLVVIWMDSFSHFIHLSDIICGFRPRPVCQSIYGILNVVDLCKGYERKEEEEK